MEGPHNTSQPWEDDTEGEQSRRKRGRPAQPHCCQVCGQDLEVAGSRYHKRYKICGPHMMADALEVDGIMQRFCQQCGRFHVLEEFEGSKRSCREQLEKQALRRRLARRAAATQSQGGPQQSGSPANCSSGAGRSGENALRLQREVWAEQLFDGAEQGAAAAAAAPRMQREAQAEQLLGAGDVRAAAAAIAQQPPQPPPPPWLAGAPLARPATAAEQLAALLLQQKQPAANLGPQLDGQALPSQQQLLQQYGSDQSQHSLIALARAMSAGTAAALPSPIAPITPPSAEDLAQTPRQQAAAALLPVLAQPSLSPLLQALLALPPPAPQHPQQQQPPPAPPP